MTQENSAPYRQFQNSVEREVQTIEKAMAAVLHSQPLLGADAWDLAMHYVSDRKNNVPNVHHRYKSPNQMCTGKRTDLSRQYQFAFGDLVAVGIPKELREWKFDLRNDLGIYVGQPDGMVDTHYVYMPHTRTVLTRGSVRKVNITDTDFMRYYQRRMEMRDPSFRQKVTDIMADVMEIATGGPGQTDTTQDSDSEGVTPSSTLSTEQLEVMRQRVPLEAETAGMQPDISESDTEVALDFSTPPVAFGTADRMTMPLADKDVVLPTTDREDGLRRSSRLAARTQASSAQVGEGNEPQSLSESEEVQNLALTAMRAYAAKVTTKNALRSVEKEEWLEAIRTEINQLFDG
jgi:hypothetical protein